MSIEQEILDRVSALPLDKRIEVRDFADFLLHRGTAQQPLRDLEGAWRDQHVHVTEEDISEVRREMWKNFPREEPK